MHSSRYDKIEVKYRWRKWTCIRFAATISCLETIIKNFCWRCNISSFFWWCTWRALPNKFWIEMVKQAIFEKTTNNIKWRIRFLWSTFAKKYVSCPTIIIIFKKCYKVKKRVKFKMCTERKWKWIREKLHWTKWGEKTTSKVKLRDGRCIRNEEKIQELGRIEVNFVSLLEFCIRVEKEIR